MTDQPPVDTTETTFGSGGIVERILYPPDAPNADTTVCAYLITAPGVHPAWDQWLLAVVSLKEIPGSRPAVLQFPGATHELLEAAINPALGRLSPLNYVDRVTSAGQSTLLSPINIAHQFTATDDEMTELAWLIGRAVAGGLVPPEPPFGLESFREQWLAVCVRTLAHMRGEEHAH